MPAWEVMFKELVQRADDPEFRELARQLLDSGAPLVDVVKELGLVRNAGQAEFIGQLPPALEAALLAAVADNLGRDEPKQMMFVWTAGYDWELRITESRSSIVSEGGITIHVKSRYPGDPRPGRGE